MRISVLHILIIALVLIPCKIKGEMPAQFPFRAEILPGYEEDEVKSRCDAMDLQPIEGIWYYPDEMMTVVVERCPNPLNDVSADYRIVLVSANDMSLLPGTVIGYCTQSADRDKYQLWIYSEQCGSLIENPQKCVAVLNKDRDELLIERSEVNVRVRVNFSRFLPKLLKGISIVANKNDVKVPEGFRKIYPENPKRSGVVRYL